jgi:hypothetical protein
VCEGCGWDRWVEACPGAERRTTCTGTSSAPGQGLLTQGLAPNLRMPAGHPAGVEASQRLDPHISWHQSSASWPPTHPVDLDPDAPSIQISGDLQKLATPAHAASDQVHKAKLWSRNKQAAAASVLRAAGRAAELHVMREGEDAWEVCNRHGLGMPELQRLNPGGAGRQARASGVCVLLAGGNCRPTDFCLLLSSVQPSAPLARLHTLQGIYLGGLPSPRPWQ